MFQEENRLAKAQGYKNQRQKQIKQQMSKKADFKEYSVIACGTLSAELNVLAKEGFLNADKVLYTAPGLHETPWKFERQLKKQFDNTKKYTRKILAVYGQKCFVDINDPARGIDGIIRETGANARRIKAKNCVDMLADIDEREKIAGGQKVYWLTPGWLRYWKVIFKDWDQGKANETFPQHDKAVLLDPVGMFEEYSTHSPEKVLEFADWMRLNIEPCKISLDRLKGLLLEGIS